MQGFDYSKYKDRLPQDTIFAIQKILNEAAIQDLSDEDIAKVAGGGVSELISSAVGSFAGSALVTFSVLKAAAAAEF